MAPKTVSLAYAGRKLTGPPEGYGKKKELEVKKWILGLPPPEDAELIEVASVATLTEIDGSKEDLYRSLRDSTDGYGPPRRSSTTPFPDPPRATATPKPHTGSPGVPNRADAGRQQAAVGLRAGAAGTAAGRLGVAGGAPLDASASGPQSGSAVQPGAGPGRGPADAAGPGGVRASGGRPGQPPEREASLRRAGPEAGAGDLGLGVGHSLTLDAGVEVGLLLARVEATLPPGETVEEKYRRALMLALEEQQRYKEDVRRELAAVRALAAEAKAEAQRCAADAEVAARRASEAEAELGRARGEALAHRQEAQRLQLELQEHHDDRSDALARSQAELADLAAQLREQTARSNAAMQSYAGEAAAARSAASGLQRELAVLCRAFELEKTKTEAQLASYQADLQAERRAAAALRAESDKVAAALQVEVAARKAAEESEKKALRTAAKQAEVQDAMQAAALAAQAAKQRVASAAQRAAAVRAANPAAAALEAAATAAAVEEAAARGPATTPRAAAAATSSPATPNSAGKQAGRGPQPAAGSPGADGGDGGAAARGPGGPDPRALHRGLGAAVERSRRQLGDLLQQGKRAAAAAELADARAAEASLSSAPEHLRAMGLAFRAYLVAGEGGAAPGSPAAALLGRVAAEGYRCYVDPMAVAQPGPDAALYHVPSAPLVGLSAAVVMVAAPGLLRRPLPRGELSTAARHGCPLVVLAAPGTTLESLMDGEEPPLVGGAADPAAAQHAEMALAHVRAAWASRLELPADSPAAPRAVAARLGLPDPALALMPPDALRALAVPRNRAMPDLAHLNAPALQHLKLANADGAAGGSWPLADVLCGVLRGNSTLTSLTMRGCPAAAARAISEAILSSPASRISTVAISARVPLADLAGRPRPGGPPAPPVIDLGSAGPWGGAPGGARPAPVEQPLTDEDAEVVAAALRARAEAEAAGGVAGAGEGDEGGQGPPPLAALTLPASCNERLGRAAVAELVAALGALRGLQAVNGVGLEAAAAAALPASGSPQRAGGAGGGRSLLDLSGTRCGPIVLALLLSRLREQAALSQLTAVNLTGCEVGPIGVSYLATAASEGGGLPQLETACLADNSLGPEGLNSLLCSLLGGPSRPGPCSPLAVLDLSINGLGDAGCKDLCRSLPLLGGTGLRVLVLSHNGIGTEGARALAVALPSCTSLQELLLAGNQLGDQAARELAAALGRGPLPRLALLSLADNPRLGADGVAGLAAAMAGGGLPGLAALDLARTHAGNEGARHLAQALHVHPALTSLSLEACKIRADGAAHLAAALASTRTGPSAPLPPSGPLPLPLSHLNLARNQLGDRGATALAEALSHARCRCLVSLDLRANGVGLVGCRALGGALRERNGSLRVLAVAGNEMEDDVLQALEDLAASHRPNVRPLAPVEHQQQPSSAAASSPAAARRRPASAAPGPAPAGAPAGAQVAGGPATRPASAYTSDGHAAAAAVAAVVGKPRPAVGAAPAGRVPAQGPGGGMHLATTPRRPAEGPSMGTPRAAATSQDAVGTGAGRQAPASRAGAGAGVAAAAVRASGPSGVHGPGREVGLDDLLEAAVGGMAGGGVGAVAGGEDEDLEALLSRYRTPGQGPGAAAADGGSPLVCLGYTGM